MTILPRALVVAVMALLVYLVYLPGISGALYYDDYANLQGLEVLAGGGDAAAFVFGGNAGPLGRPLALLSFVPHAVGWPDSASEMLHVNVLIHVANMVLLFLLGQMLLRQLMPGDERRAFRIAATAALMWAVMPLLVSTSLIAIQRMTGLAALFGLLGLVGFVHGYRYAEKAPLKAFLVQLGTLGVGSLLALLSKESGALVPIFALLIDCIIFSNRQYDRRWRLALRSVLVLCMSVPLYYVSPLAHDLFMVNEFRGFSPWQRLESQVVFLWEYLWRAFLPQRPTAFGPFHDYQGLVQNVGLVSLAAIAWVLSVIFAATRRRTAPLFLFALLWYLTGHLLESTTVLLELIFEHRNYLAVYGFCLLISWAAWTAQGKLRRLAPALVGVYIGLFASVTLAMTVLWGDPVKAANVWADSNPGSARAALHAALTEFAQIQGDQLGKRSDLLGHQAMTRALMILDRTAKVCPDCLDVRLQALAYSCRLTDAADTRERFDELLKRGASGGVTIAVVDAFFPLHQLVELNACEPITHSDLLALSEAVIANPQSSTMAYRTRMYFIAAMNANSLGDDAKVEALLAAGERRAAMALPILEFQVHHYLKLGRIEEARQAIERRRGVFGSSASPVHVEALNSLSTMLDQASRNPPE